jgi:hypothetical protein
MSEASMDGGTFSSEVPFDGAETRGAMDGLDCVPITS